MFWEVSLKVILVHGRSWDTDTKIPGIRAFQAKEIVNDNNIKMRVLQPKFAILRIILHGDQGDF